MSKIGTLFLTLAASVSLLAGPAFAGTAPAAGSKTITGALKSDGSGVGDKWAVVVGINEFSDPSVPTLKYSAKDAKDFYDYLTNPAGGNFQKDHVRLLLNKDATKINIMDALGDSFLPHAAAPGDLVVIYVSTHGSPPSADVCGVNYVIAHDTQVRKLFATGIEMQQFARLIKERVHTNRVVLVMDTCYSGAGAAASEHKGIFRSNIDALKTSQAAGSVVIASSAPDQRAWESDNLHNSYFTRYFIDSLSSDGSKGTIEQAFASMRPKVQGDVLRDKGEVQTPVICGDSGQKIVLSIKPSQPHAAPVLLPDSTDNGGAQNLIASAATDGARSTDGGGAVDLTNYVSHMRNANDLIQQRKLWDAIHELQEAVQQDPKSIEAFLVTAEIYDQQSRYAEELTAARKAVVNDDNSAQARQQLGWAYLRNGNVDEALRQTQMSIALDPSSSMAHDQLGYIDEHNFNKADEAAQEYRKALDLNPANVRALVDLGLLQQKAGRNDEAEKLFHRAIDADADDWQALLALAKLDCSAKNDYHTAETDLRKAIAAAPGNWHLHSELGKVLWHDKTKYADAEAELRKGIEIAPQVGAPHAMLADFLVNAQGRVEEAEKEYRKAIELDPDIDSARVALGNVLLDYKKVYDEADAQFRAALKTNPSNPGAWIGIGHISDRLYKDLTRSESEIRKAITLDPNSSYAYDQLGALFSTHNVRSAEAQQAFEKAISLDPQNAQAHYHLGALLSQTGKEPERAKDELEKAIALSPAVSEYQTKLGMLLTGQMKRHKDAETIFRQAIATNMADAEAHYRLGLLLIEKLGSRQSGETELRKARELNAQDDSIKTAYERYVR